MVTSIFSKPKKRIQFLLLKLFLVSVLTCGFIGLFFLFFPVIKGSSTPLGLIPIILAGWFFGIKGGLIEGLLVISVPFILYRHFIHKELDSFPLEAVPIAFTILLVGILVGWLKSSMDRLKVQTAKLREQRRMLEEELEERKTIAMALREFKQDFDRSIEKKTEKLSEENELLRKKLSKLQEAVQRDYGRIDR